MVSSRSSTGELTLKYRTAKMRFSMKSMDHLMVHIDRPYRVWTMRKDCARTVSARVNFHFERDGARYSPG